MVIVVVVIVVITTCLNADISLTFLFRLYSLIRNLTRLRRSLLTNAYRIAFLAPYCQPRLAIYLHIN